jgi:hypothetical protein
VKRMDAAVSTEVVCRGPGVELVGGQRVLAGDDSELFYLRLLVECPLSLTHRAVTLSGRLDFGFYFKGDAPAMTGPCVCRHGLPPTPDAQLTCRGRLREDAQRAKSASPPANLAHSGEDSEINSSTDLKSFQDRGYPIHLRRIQLSLPARLKDSWF